MKKEIQVVICNVGENPIIKTVPNELETFQGIVGGYIEYVRFDDAPNLLMILNEEGKLTGLKPNLHMPYDTIVGNLVFVSSDGEDFDSLTEKDIKVVEGFIERFTIGGRE